MDTSAMGPGLFFCLLAAAVHLAGIDPLSNGSAHGTAAKLALPLGLFAIGVALLFRRAQHPMPKWLARLGALVSVLCLIEIFSFAGVLFLTPKELLSDASRVLEIHKKAQFRPYLWSNYAPNPGATDVNEFGWRFGGGPRRNKLRILALGGSGTWSDGASTGAASYPAQTQHFLRLKGYDVDVVNAGVPYQASTETLGLFAYRGLDEKPDLALIKVGENDLEPLLSPAPYQSDYTHWRTLRPESKEANALFLKAWHIPSWTGRLVALHLLHPSGFAENALATQVTTGEQALFADTDPNDPGRRGLERHLRSLVGVARANGVQPVLVTFRLNVDHPKATIFGYGRPEKEVERAKRRWIAAIDSENETIRRVAAALAVPILPADTFQPSSAERWIDHAHFDDAGYHEMGEFVGDWLDKSGLLETAKSHLPGKS